MNAPTRRIFAVAFVIWVAKSENPCGGEESAAVKTLAANLGINSFTFVQDEIGVSFLKKIREFRGSFSAFTNTDELEAILDDEPRQKEFFERRTILVTREKLNFTTALEKLSGHQSVTWAVFIKSLADVNASYIPINVNFYTFRCAPTGIAVNRAYNIKPGLRLSVNAIRAGEPPEPSRIQNFENATLDLLFLFAQEECGRRTHVLDKIECYHQEIVQILAERLNATVNRMRCPERLYPYNFPNGSLSDMFLILQRAEADISSGSYIISNSRLNDYDFAWPVFTTKSMMYIKYESVKSRWRAYLRPVGAHAWSAIVSWILITGFLLQFFEESRRRHFKLRFSLIPDLIKSVFLSLQLFCNQGLDDVPHWNSNRIVFTFSLLLCVSLYEAYCAFLISALTVTTPNIPFNGLEGFLSDGTYKILTLKKGFHNYYIRKTLGEIGKGTDLFEDELDLPSSPQGGIDALCTRPKITYVEFRENIVRNEITCKLLELPNSIFRQSIGIGLPKNSPFKEIFTQQVTTLRSSGVIHRMRRYLLSYVTLQEREISNEQFIHVSFGHVVSIFFIIAAGTALSIIIFLLEICLGFSKTSNKKTKKRTKHNVVRVKRIQISRGQTNTATPFP